MARHCERDAAKDSRSSFNVPDSVGRMPAVVACGSRNDAYDSYCTAIANAGQNDFPILLVDSEAAVTQEPWDHLKARDNWDRPDNAIDEHAHLMVQCMEAWFVADRELLARFFGQGFSENPLPGDSRHRSDTKAKCLPCARDGHSTKQNEGPIWQGQALV